MTMSGSPPPRVGTGTTAVLPVVAGHTVKEVTFPRRNSDAGLAPYSIKSETYDPRSANY
jgi:hypothetical protein